jgi:nitrogen-specific signal transduction histidine kinase/CheY-like chemotaxis protein
MEASVERDAEGGPRYRAIVSDITEHKRANEEREKLVAQLAQAQKMEAIGTLAGGVAHDFNNILGGILSGLSLLELDLDPGKALQDIAEMKLLVERAATLTRQLLGFARRGSYDARPLDVALVARKTLEMFGRARKDITIVSDCAPVASAVLIDHAQLEQVLLNLFVNAGHAMPEGGRLVLKTEIVALAREEVEAYGVEPGRFVKVVVTDTGGGMDAATQTRIFEPFFTTKGRGIGAGLGLAAVYGIVRSHRGFICVDSALGSGTTLTVFLPLTEQPPEAESVSPEEVRPGEGTILVVDDDEVLVKLCARMLNRIGYNVMTASSGVRAIELMRQHKDQISLVILDIIMPEMSGSQVYDALKEIAPATKVLLASGYSVEGQAQELLARGCNGFIQKPFSVADLSVKLRELL